MPPLELHYRLIDEALRAGGLDLCESMQRYLEDRGITTSNWRFDAETELRLQDLSLNEKSCARPIVEFTLETGGDIRRILFLGPVCVWQPSLFRGVTPVSAMPPEQVWDFFSEIHDVRATLCTVLNSPQAFRHGLIPWAKYGNSSRLMCVLDEVPGPAVLPIPIEDVLPTGCMVHLVDAYDGQATQAAVATAEAVRRRGRHIVWIAKSPPLPSHLAPQSVEQALQTWHASMGVKNSKTGDPDRPGLIVFEHPTFLPLQKDFEANGPLPPVSPEAVVTWANMLPQMILHDTTILIVNSVHKGAHYPDDVPVDIQPWRANAKYECVYGKAHD